MTNKTNSMMKIPLIVAAAVIIIRIILEHVGSPEAVNAVFGVAWLYFIIPVLFALQISKSGDSSPYKSLFISLLLFAVYTRLMVFVTYMLAWWQQWQAPRFSLAQGGVVGEGVTALQGLLIIPLRNAGIWIIFIIIIGMIIGTLILGCIHQIRKGEMNLSQILFSFEGRINRSTFWLFSISLNIFSIIGLLIDVALTKNPGFFLLLGVCLTIWPSLAINTKRSHDRNKSGWFILISLIPLLNLWYLIEIGFLRGTEGNNQYGLQP